MEDSLNLAHMMSGAH